MKNKNKKTLIKIFLIGLVIRLLVMPFTTMTDLPQTYYEVDKWMPVEGIKVLVFPQGLSYGIQYVWFSGLKMLFKNDFWFDETKVIPYNQDEYMKYTYSILNSFLSSGIPPLKIFLFKLPFLFFDIASIILLMKIIPDEEKILSVWAYNPILIFIVYILGTVEIIGLMFLVLAFYYLHKNNYLLGFFSVCLSVWSKLSFGLILPFIIIYLSKNKKIMPVLLLIPFGIILLLSGILRNFFNITLVSWPYNYMFLTKIGEQREIYIFIAVYFFILMTYIFSKRRDYISLWKFCYIGVLSFFATSFFHLQWFLITIPFSLFFLLENQKNYYLHLIETISFFSLLLFFGNHLTLNLFAPINASILNFKDIKDIINAFFPSSILVNIVWSIFVSVIVFKIFTLKKSMENN
jgi:hypothetical protein